MANFSAASTYAIVAPMDVAERNRVRAEARLPLLDLAKETARLKETEGEVLFERDWERRRPEFADWIGSGQG